MRHLFTAAAIALCALSLILVRPLRRLGAQSLRVSAPVQWNSQASQILIRYGVTDTATRIWHGYAETGAGGGSILALSGYHFQAEDVFSASDGGVREFTFSTRAWTPNVQQVDLSPVLPGPRPVFPNGIYLTVTGGPDAQFHIVAAPNTPGDFSFRLGDLESRKQLTFENGDIEVERVALPFALSAPAPQSKSGEADFPSIALGPGQRIAVVWQEFLGDRDRILSREWDGAHWGDTEALESDETRDVFRPSAAYDGQGQLHVIWSGQVDHNFDLYERRKTGAQWSAVERLTTAPGADLHQKVIADKAGDLWLAWQAFRDAQSDIYLKQFHGGKWGEERKVSESAANDWGPSLAAAPNGTVWIGWDTYDRGNYDVVVRSFTGNQFGAIRAITTSPRFEAHASLAADREGRLWIAFDEAEANWGKDYGYLVKTAGNPLYQSRKLHVVRLTGDVLEEPSAKLGAAFPLYLPRFLQNPQIAVAADGTVAVAALQLTHSNSVIEVWGANGIWENVVFTLDGAGWRRNQSLPESAGANDQRIALAAASDGQLWAAWAADNRDYAAARPRMQVVNAALVPYERASGDIAMQPFVERPELSQPQNVTEAADLKTVRAYRIRTDTGNLRIMRGDLHRHTSLSTDGVGDGSLWDFYRYALDAVNLDFSTVTDHQGGATSYNWWKTQKSSDMFQTRGRLQTLYAYERSVVYPNGHRNMVFTERGVPILPIDPAEMTGPDKPGTKRSSEVVLPYLRQYNGIAFRHTTATDQGTDWGDHNNTLEPMVEIYQGHRLVYEHEGGPKAPTAEKLYTQRSGYRPAGYFWNALAKGYRMGIEASSDHCSTHISYSCILVTGDSRQDLVDAMRKRHTYGATDNIVLDFRVKANGREYIQGDEVPNAGNYVMSVNAIGTGPIKRVDVIHNESYAYNLLGARKSAVRFTYTDAHPAPGENRYYVRVEQEDGNFAWSSPVWVERKGN